MVSRMCSSPHIQATKRSTPMPKPACGTLPNLREIEIPVERFLRQMVFLQALPQQIQIVNALAAADDFAVAFGRENVDAQGDVRPVRIGLEVERLYLSG